MVYNVLCSVTAVFSVMFFQTPPPPRVFDIRTVYFGGGEVKLKVQELNLRNLIEKQHKILNQTISHKIIIDHDFSYHRKIPMSELKKKK